VATATDEIYVKILTDTNQAIQGLTHFASMVAKAAAAMYAFKKVVIDSFKSYMDAEVAERRLAVAMKITGQASEAGLRNLTSYAKGLQLTTTYSDEANMSAMGLLMQIGNLTERGIKTALPLLQDYASAMGIDLTTAAEQMGQAIAGGRNMFQKYGIQLKDTMSASEKFDTIMKGLTDKFGGFEAQLAKTTSGQMKILKNQVDELKEALGGMFAQAANPILKATLTLLTGEMTIARPVSSYKTKDDVNQTLKVLQDYKKQLEGLNTWIEGSPLKAFWYQMFGKNADLTISDINNRISDLITIMRVMPDATSGAAGGVNVLTKAFDSLGSTLKEVGQRLYPTLQAYAQSQQPLDMDMMDALRPKESYGATPAEKTKYSGNKPNAGSGGGWKEVAQWLRDATEAEQKFNAEVKATYEMFQGIAASARGVADSLVAGDITGAMQKIAAAALDALTNQALLAAATAAATGNWVLMAFWLGIAGATILGSAYASAGGGNGSGGGATATPDIPYLSKGGTTIIVQGSVWAERDLASVVAAAQGNW